MRNIQYRLCFFWRWEGEAKLLCLTFFALAAKKLGAKFDIELIEHFLFFYIYFHILEFLFLFYLPALIGSNLSCIAKKAGIQVNSTHSANI